MTERQEQARQVANGLREVMPPWFVKVMESCEALGLDTYRDQVLLWERISEAWPHAAIEAMIADNITARDLGHDDERSVARIKAAVISALEEA